MFGPKWEFRNPFQKYKIGASKFWGIMTFTSSYHLLPFNYDLVQKVKNVIQRSMLNFFKILMWGASYSYNMMYANPKELLYS